MIGKIKYEYRIYNKLTEEYVNFGYRSKSIWRRFPKYFTQDLNDDYEVHKFEYVQHDIIKLNLKGDELN
jgi:hypothetical protein